MMGLSCQFKPASMGKSIDFQGWTKQTCLKWPAEPPWIEASPPGDAPAECPVLLKKDVKVPLLPLKKPLLCCGEALRRELYEPPLAGLIFR